MLVTSWGFRFSGEPIVRSVKKWTEELKLNLQACFDCTDWNVFEAATPDLHGLSDTVTSYISFCEDLCVQTNTFRTFNNSKPWFTPNLSQLRQAKEEAYRSGDRALFKQARNTLTREIRKAKRGYRDNLESRLSANPNPSSVWRGLQSIAVYKRPSPTLRRTSCLQNG